MYFLPTISFENLVSINHINNCIKTQIEIMKIGISLKLSSKETKREQKKKLIFFANSKLFFLEED